MDQRILGSLQFLLAVLMCATVGTPQATVSSIQHFMFNEHIYEDRCTVTNYLASKLPVYCLESRVAYVNVYNAAGLGFALAVVPAYYSTKFLGFSFTSMACCLILAAGSVLITDRPEDQWLTDRFAYGYALVSVSAPFAIFNVFSSISFIQASRINRLMFTAFFLSVLELGPLIWTAFNWQFSSNGLLIQDLFRNLLWLPCIWLLATVLLMPFSDSNHELQIYVLLQHLNAQFSLSGHKPQEYSDETTLVNYSADASDYNHKPTYARNLLSLPFFSLLLVYVANSLPLDLMFLGGEARAAFHEELAVWPEITMFSPILACFAVPLFVYMTSKWGIRAFAGLTCILSILQTLAQYWSVRASWLLASILVGSTQAALAWTIGLCFIKFVRAELFSLTTAMFLVGVNLIKFSILPVIDVSIEFDELIWGCSPYILILGLQVVSTLLFALVLKKEVHRELRFYLEIEARSAFETSAV